MLRPADQDHARRVLRLAPGDLLLGIDGRGAEWPLRVASASRHGFELEASGEPRRTPAPGAAGGVPWVEILAPCPRPGEAEQMADQLTQVGVARWTLIETERSGRGAERARQDRLRRAAEEALKQCGRLWDLEIEGPMPIEEALAGGPRGRDLVLRPGCPPPPGPGEAGATRLWIGPEGGFSEAEEALLQHHGAVPTGLSPHTLRTSLAAVLGAGLLLSGPRANQVGSAD